MSGLAVTNQKQAFFFNSILYISSLLIRRLILISIHEIPNHLTASTVGGQLLTCYFAIYTLRQNLSGLLFHTILYISDYAPVMLTFSEFSLRNDCRSRCIFHHAE